MSPSAPTLLPTGASRASARVGSTLQSEARGPVDAPRTDASAPSDSRASEAPADEAQLRLVEILEEFDTSGELKTHLNDVMQVLQEVAAASAESPLLDPAAALLGDQPRPSLSHLLGSAQTWAGGKAAAGEGSDSESPQALANALMGLVQARLMPSATPASAAVASPSAAQSGGPNVPMNPSLAAKTPASGAPSVRWSVQTSKPAPAPVATSSSPASSAPSAGTFDASPWLVPFRAERGVPEAPPAFKLKPSLAMPIAAAGMEASLDATADTGAWSSASASKSAGAAARVAQPQALAPNVLATAPEVPVMLNEKPLTRLQARVSDGERVLDVGVARESDGYAVEVRAPRDFVAEIREMEGDIDAALRDDGGDGLASFDASAEDEYAAPEPDPIEAPRSGVDEPQSSQPSSDPRRILDRRV